MIICEQHGFAFVHIPKCAGSSVRQQIEAYDDDRGFFAKVRTHPTLGRIDFGHIPLAMLRQHFPDAYARLRRVESFAITRDPLDRFGSSLRQTLWMYDKRPMTLIPFGELRDIALRLLDRIDRELDAPSPELSFFARQVDFVHDGGERVVTRLYPIERTAAFIEVLSRRIGQPLDTGRRSNQNVDLRFKAGGSALFALNGALRRMLPRDAHAALKRLVLPLVAKKDSAARAAGLADIPEIARFVAERYAGDAALHRLAQAEAAGPPPGVSAPPAGVSAS